MSANDAPAHKNAGNDASSDEQSQNLKRDTAASSLTQFQINILAILAEEGYVEKSELDKRTNEYALTPTGIGVLNGRLQYLADKHGYDLVPQEAPAHE